VAPSDAWNPDHFCIDQSFIRGKCIRPDFTSCGMGDPCVYAKKDEETGNRIKPCGSENCENGDDACCANECEGT
jgi:hypothetical protein